MSEPDVRAPAPLPPDWEIARAYEPEPLEVVGSKLGLAPTELRPYADVAAKLSDAAVQRLGAAAPGTLVLVTAMTATRHGAGKTVHTIGLAQALRRLGHRATACIREPSLGPVFGIKGGAAGGGYAQVVPPDAINLHFTGDLHAVGTAHNLLAAVADNHAHWDEPLADGRTLPKGKLTWRRVMDMCDRQLRQLEAGLGTSADGYPHPSGFDITASSEVMAVLCLAADRDDLRARLARMIVGRDASEAPVRAGDTEVVGAMMALLRDAFAPNLVQTLEGGPALVHGGPFANVAHGCNSVVATRAALGGSEFVVTEAGFGADLGAEKFLHLKTPQLGLGPAAVVVVATTAALEMHGGGDPDLKQRPDHAAMLRGLPNLQTHVENLQRLGQRVIVALNRFPRDDEATLAALGGALDGLGVPWAASTLAAHGGAGGEALARLVLDAAREGNRPPGALLDPAASVESKLETLATQIYRADGVAFDDAAREDLQWLHAHGMGHLPVCVAKTQNSISDDPKALGSPRGWTLRVRRLHASAGAGFVVARCGPIVLMPGMPRRGGWLGIDLDAEGRIHGVA